METFKRLLWVTALLGIATAVAARVGSLHADDPEPQLRVLRGHKQQEDPKYKDDPRVVEALTNQRVSVVAHDGVVEEVDIRAETEWNDEILLKLRSFRRLKKLQIYHQGLRDSQMPNLAGFPSMTRLSLTSMNVTDTGLVHIAALSNLEHLSLECRLTDTGLMNLRNLEHLKSLDLMEAVNVTDRGLMEVAACQRLRSLALFGTKITDDGLAHVAKMKMLGRIIIAPSNPDASAEELVNGGRRPRKNSPRVTDKGLRHLADCPSLFAIVIDDCQGITNAGLVELKRLPQLRDLAITDCSVTNEGLKALKDCPQLCRLNVRGAAITDRCFQYVKDIPNLERLAVGQIPASEENLRELLKADNIIDLDDRTVPIEAWQWYQKAASKRMRERYEREARARDAMLRSVSVAVLETVPSVQAPGRGQPDVRVEVEIWVKADSRPTHVGYTMDGPTWTRHVYQRVTFVRHDDHWRGTITERIRPSDSSGRYAVKDLYVTTGDGNQSKKVFATTFEVD